MATSELLTMDDVDDLDTVIQLKPHQRDIEFAAVEKTEDGDLVSLDELYEKTGQESINQVIAGFSELIKRNKIRKAHGLLLKVEGAESWMELPDRMNAVKGGEGYITKIVDGFIKIVLAVIRFIKGICIWIFNRAKALLGFAKTKEEARFVYEKSEDFKKAVTDLFERLGIHGFDPKELINELPDNTLPVAHLKLLKSKFANAETVVEGYGEVIRVYNQCYRYTQQAEKNIIAAKSKYGRIVNYIKKGIKSDNGLKAGDIFSIKADVIGIAKDYLDPTPFIAAYSELAVAFYGIPETKLGVDRHIATLKEKIKNQQEQISIRYTPELYQQTIDVVRAYNENNEALVNTPLTKNAIDFLSNFITESDAVLFEALSKLANDNEILVCYLELSNTIKEYSLAVDATLKIMQEIEATLLSLTKLYTTVNLLICNAAAKNFVLFTESYENLTDEQKQIFESRNTSLFNFATLDRLFYEKYPDGRVNKFVSDYFNNFFKSSKGKRVITAANNFIRQLKR